MNTFLTPLSLLNNHAHFDLRRKLILITIKKHKIYRRRNRWWFLASHGKLLGFQTFLGTELLKRLHWNLLVATQRLRLNHFVPHCIFLRLPQGDRPTQQNNRNMLDLDSFYAGLFPWAWSKETKVELSINATKCTCTESTEHCYFSISMIDLT